MRTKVDLINAAYSRGRISGLTKNPTPEELTLALSRLENMAHEFLGRNINVNYNFEDVPDLNSDHNIEQKYWDAFETNLAVRLLGDFGKDPIASLVAFQSAGYSFLSASTAPIAQTQYPSRQPIGSGNSLRNQRWRRFYTPTTDVPLPATANPMIIGDVDDFVEHFDAYLLDAETVDSYTITADDGLSIVSDSLTTPDVDYRISAVGTSTNTTSAILTVTIVATTSTGRVETRLIPFSLSAP